MKILLGTCLVAVFRHLMSYLCKKTKKQREQTETEIPPFLRSDTGDDAPIEKSSSTDWTEVYPAREYRK